MLEYTLDGYSCDLGLVAPIEPQVVLVSKDPVSDNGCDPSTRAMEHLVGHLVRLRNRKRIRGLLGDRLESQADSARGERRHCCETCAHDQWATASKKAEDPCVS